MFYWRAICVAATGQGQAGRLSGSSVSVRLQQATDGQMERGAGKCFPMLQMLRCSDFKDTTTKHWLSAVKIGTKSFEF